MPSIEQAPLTEARRPFSLEAVVERAPLWAVDDVPPKLPWDEPGFSRRMLAEHLDQGHDRASRRFDTIDKHVAWIAGTMLGGCPSRVLDVGCGPGLSTERLAALGCRCVGIDFSPAAIEHANEIATARNLGCTPG
jgi:SAM-dependent methyltransferase